MPDKQDSIGYVYIFYAEQPDSKRYIIGFTNNVNRRLKELQSFCPIKHIKSVKLINAASSKKFLQSKYAEYKAHDEWFDFEDDQLASVLQDMNELEKISSSSYKVKKENSLLSFLFVTWCRNNNLFEEYIRIMTLGNFDYVFPKKRKCF
jgi:hypothetical protein